MTLISAVGQRIENLLHEKKITQYKLAKKGGFNRATLWHIIHPDTTQVKTVKLDTIYQIVDTLGMSLKEFFDDPIFDNVTD